MPMTQKQWIKRLRKEGWTQESGGNHQVKMTKPGYGPITLPMAKGETYSKGLESSLRRQADL